MPKIIIKILNPREKSQDITKPIEPVPVIASTKKCKLNVVKNNCPHKKNETKQKMLMIRREDFKLPKVLDLSTFFYYGDFYWIEKSTNYIFTEESINDELPQPIGKLVEIVKGRTVLDMKLEWFYEYDDDIIINEM